MKKQNNNIVISIIIVIVTISGIFAIKTKAVTSQQKLAENISTALQKQDSKLFLKQFDDNSKKSRFSNLGAKGVLKDWKNNSNLTPKEIAEKIINNKYVPGAEYNYQFSTHKRTRFGFFDDYYLSAKLTKVDPSPYVKDSKTKVNGKTVDNNDFKTGFFPGEYNFESTYKEDGESYTSKYNLYLTGDPSTMKLPFVGIDDYSSYDDESYDDSDDDYDDSTDYDESAVEQRINDKYDDVYGGEREISKHSNDDAGKYPAYEGNTYN